MQEFVNGTYDPKQWLACGLEIDKKDLEVKLSFLHRSTLSSIFFVGILAYHIYFVCPPPILLTTVDPRKTNSRLYTIK